MVTHKQKKKNKPKTIRQYEDIDGNSRMGSFCRAKHRRGARSDYLIGNKFPDLQSIITVGDPAKARGKATDGRITVPRYLLSKPTSNIHTSIIFRRAGVAGNQSRLPIGLYWPRDLYPKA